MIKNKVLVSNIVNYDSGDTIFLSSEEKILYDRDGETVIHDFSIGPIEYSKTTGVFKVNHGENPSPSVS